MRDVWNHAPPDSYRFPTRFMNAWLYLLGLKKSGAAFEVERKTLLPGAVKYFYRFLRSIIIHLM